MTTPRDPDRLIRAFLAEGPESLPDPAFDAVRADIDRTRQRVVLGPWRESHMNTFAKAAIATAAVLAVAVVGLNLLPGQGGGYGGVAPTASPTPSPTPTPTPTPVPSPSLPTGQFPPEGPIAAGTIDATSDFDLVPFSFTVPAGWRSVGWFITNDQGTAPYNLRLTFVPVANLYADPCLGTVADPVVGPTVADLTSALMTLKGTTGATSTDVVLDGRPATLVEYRIPADSHCTDDEFFLWRDALDSDFWTWPPYGDTVQTWIVDVDGHRFVMTADIQADATAAQKAELQQVIDSVTFGG